MSDPFSSDDKNLLAFNIIFNMSLCRYKSDEIHLGWFGGIDLGSGSVLLLKVLSSIINYSNFDTTKIP